VAIGHKQKPLIDVVLMLDIGLQMICNSRLRVKREMK